MNILITGAGGFVGSKLVPALLANGEDHVFGTTVAPTGLTSPRYHELVVDLSKPDFLAALPASVDVVVHLAQSLGYRNFPSAAEDMFAVNVESTMRLLEWSRAHGVKGFCFASTGNVYRPSSDALKETDPCEAASFYGASKLAAETVARPYGTIFPVTVLRIFGVYGPGQQAMVVHDMIQRIESGAEITLAEDRGLVFNPMYVDDCVETLQRLVRAPGGLPNGVFNLGGKEPVDLRTIVTTLGRHLGIAPKIRTTDGRATYLLGDSSKLYAQIDYQPRVGIEEGLSRMVRHLKTAGTK